MATVTIVVATYDRPLHLKNTISSILHQTFEDWLLLVVGDACSPETQEAMEVFNDERIFYLNLAERCGEQGGPNSAGFYAAETEYVAFANHDDIWLPDHLQRAISTLETGETDFYAAGAALTVSALPRNLPVAWERTPLGRSAADAFLNMPVLFEPVSAWVVRRSLLKTVGAWRPASQIYRTPLEDWVLRAWRADVSCHFDDEISVIYCNAEKVRGSGPASGYKDNNAECEGAFWLKLLEEKGGKNLRSLIGKQLRSFDGKRKWTFLRRQYEMKDSAWVFDGLLTKETARLYKEFGWDAHAQACSMLSTRRGQAMALMLKRRTGEDLPRHENWRAIAHTAKTRLQADARWRKMNADA
ncbi:glycosyltransferase family 2 protein [Kordiimonas sp.]|uniref:glycosyltransferase family 2 protein n=1 Tax=Kordiimonas sp. TaxID=1970157 RepID=UPI003A93CAFB